MENISFKMLACGKPWQGFIVITTVLLTIIVIVFRIKMNDGGNGKVLHP